MFARRDRDRQRAACSPARPPPPPPSRRPAACPPAGPHAPSSSSPAAMSSTMPWTEKYRPRNINDVAHQEEVVATLQSALGSGNVRWLAGCCWGWRAGGRQGWPAVRGQQLARARARQLSCGVSSLLVEQQASRHATKTQALPCCSPPLLQLPHLLFYGPPGTGKTTAALAIVRQLFGPELCRSRVLELNASDERGIAVVRPPARRRSRACAPAHLPARRRSCMPAWSGLAGRGPVSRVRTPSHSPPPTPPALPPGARQDQGLCRQRGGRRRARLPLPALQGAAPGPAGCRAAEAAVGPGAGARCACTQSPSLAHQPRSPRHHPPPHPCCLARSSSWTRRTPRLQHPPPLATPHQLCMDPLPTGAGRHPGRGGCDDGGRPERAAPHHGDVQQGGRG